MAKKQNKAAIEYRKQRKRIQSSIRRLEKRGYVFQDTVLPDTPKKITPASIRRLEKINMTQLYKKAVKLDTETGEITPGILAKAKERSEAGKKATETRKRKAKQKIYEESAGNYDTFPSETDIIIQNFKADVISRFPENAGPILERWLNDLERLYSKNDIATMLQTAAENGVFIDYKVAYSNDLLMGAIAEFMDFMPDASEGVKQDLLDRLEYEEDWELPD